MYRDNMNYFSNKKLFVFCFLNKLFKNRLRIRFFTVWKWSSDQRDKKRFFERIVTLIRIGNIIVLPDERKKLTYNFDGGTTEITVPEDTLSTETFKCHILKCAWTFKRSWYPWFTYGHLLPAHTLQKRWTRRRPRLFTHLRVR